MELVQIQVSVPKEAEAIRELISTILSDVIAKKDIASLVSDVIPKLVSVVAGVQSLSEEAKSGAMIDAAALLASDIVKIVAKK